MDLKFCVHALESLLRGSDWENKFRDFYYTVCPRFKAFNRCKEQPSRRDGGDGTGYDLIMYDAYKDFLSLFDLNIQKYLDQMKVSHFTLADSLALNLRHGDSSAQRLLSLLEMYTNFEKFGHIMICKYEEIFVSKKRDESEVSVSLFEKQGQNFGSTNHQNFANNLKTRVRSVSCFDGILGKCLEWKTSIR
mmetsp:Transcript_18479/g.17789  ORF Transcript_18479/g.17789 Transcript_18479/m.17789 type:complete len:191 (-) Transcript_18479:53-625(-)